MSDRGLPRTVNSYPPAEDVVQAYRDWFEGLPLCDCGEEVVVVPPDRTTVNPDPDCERCHGTGRIFKDP